MAPSASSPSEVLCDPLRQKFIDILRSNGITHDVEKLTMTEPQELIGEHMASASVYVLVEFKDVSIKPKNLFVKKFATSAAHVEFTKKMRIMAKESEFFNVFLPKCKKFCENFEGCENLLDFFPKCFYGDEDMVVLENLVLDDTFIMLDKEIRHDLFTAKYVLKNLAQFHATTHAFIEDECGGSDKFRQDWDLVCFEAFISDNNPMMAGMFDNGTNTDINLIKGYPVEGHAEAIETLTSYFGKTFQVVSNLLKPKSGDKLYVLNHGDCWNNNMLFKLDPETGRVNDHVFVDFQEFVKDFREKSQFGYFFSLCFLTMAGALKEIDMNNMSSDPEEMVAQFSATIENWIERNPDKAGKISSELVAVIKENDKLQKGV